jgi:hypothetical protein
MDRLLRWVKDIREATYIDVQNVADYFWSHDEDYWDLVNFNLAPPFSFFATRYGLPEVVRSTKFGEVPRPEHKGVEILTVFRQTAGIPNYTRGPDALYASLSARTPVSGAKWHYDIFVFPVKGRVAYPPSLFFTAVNELGQIARYDNQSGRAFWQATQYPHFEINVQSPTYLHVSGLALTFLNSRNVELLKPPPGSSKKRRPRKEKFESRYYRIKVNAIGQRYERIGGRGATGISQALHIVRGHFREYGPEFGKGLLFGKYAGRFWVAAHTSGSPESGVVVKDYEVEAPE